MMLVRGCHSETAHRLGDIRSLVRRQVKACADKSSVSVKSHRSTDKHGETVALPPAPPPRLCHRHIPHVHMKYPK